MPEPPEWESEYKLWQIDLQNKHNKVLPDEFIQPKTTYEQGETEEGSQQWQPAPRVTEADHAKDTKSLWRRLDRRLFLLVKTKGIDCYALMILSYIGALHTSSCSGCESKSTAQNDDKIVETAGSGQCSDSCLQSSLTAP